MTCSSDFSLEEIADMAECIAVNVDPMDVDPKYDHIVAACHKFQFPENYDDEHSTES